MLQTDGWDGPEWDTWKGTLAKWMFLPTLWFTFWVIGLLFR